ncbi:MAG: Na/Pi cotransporter family protein [Desulfobacterium sp.]|nr:Na/Pi cotransporter family protein [Desulfobacterium sp.]
MKKVASIRLKTILGKATANPLKGLFAGTIVTFLVQSSSVTVLLLLGLVNAGVMNLRQAVYVILGSEIGTTITAQIVAFKITVFFFPLIIAGFVLRAAFPARENLRNIGEALFCLGLVFLSMKIMSDGAKPIKDYPLIMDVIVQFGRFPLYGIIIGAIFTTVTNSSSATTSLVIAMSMEGVVDLTTGISLIIGANIGTCVLELIAIVGTNISAKRTGMAQFVINLMGALLIYPFIFPFSELIASTAQDIPRQIANAHTVFNVAVSFIFLPFTSALIFILKKIIPGEDINVTETSRGLDENILKVPALALYQAEEELRKMAFLTEEMLKLARAAFFAGDKKAGETVTKHKKTVEAMHYNLTNYIGKITVLLLSNRDISRRRAISRSLADIERIADLAKNLAEYAKQKEIVFSEPTKRKLEKIFNKTVNVYSAAVQALKRKRKAVITNATRLENMTDSFEPDYSKKHYGRLKQRKGITGLDLFYPVVLRDLERIGDHSYYIVEHFNDL